MSDTIQKVAIYCRLSEEDKDKLHKMDDSESIRNQKAMLLRYVIEHGWELYDIYSDDNYAGADRKRPEYNRLLRDAEAHKFDIVLCKSQSRFTRELEHVEKYINGLLPYWGISFKSVADNADTDVKGNKKARQINGLVNEWYIEDMSENIKCSLTIKRQNGLHIGSFALYGYMKDPQRKGHLIVDDEAAEIVREIFTLFSQGVGKTAIAKRLNDRGIPNPTEYKRLKGLQYKQPTSPNSALWRYSAISNMLTNEIYIGHMVQGKYGSVSYKTKENKPRPKEQWYRVENTHEPIIDRALWDSVQSMVKSRVKPFITGELGLFAGKVQCAGCGYTMRSSKSRDVRYLQCATKYVAQNACDGAFISVKTLESIVIGELKRMTEALIDPNELEQVSVFENELKKRIKRCMDEIKKYGKLLDNSTRVMADCYRDKSNGNLDIEEYNIIVRQLKADKKKYEAIIAEDEKLIIELNKRIFNGDNRRAQVEQYINITELNRETVDVMIDHIVVGRRIKGTQNYPVEIYWSF